MATDNRKQQILDLIKTNGSVKVTELSTLLDVSEVTIRNYLADMETKGLLSRVHGGAVSSYKPYYSMNMTQRLETNQTEKVEIAQKIAAMIEPNDTIMLNSGTTTLLTFRKFPVDYNLNIVTNSIAIALEASSNPNYNVVLIGGSINTKYQFSYGSDAIAQLRNYHAEKLILSVDGIDLKHGFTTYYDKESPIDRAMTEQSDYCIIAADDSKFGNNAFAKICDLSVADCIVTNDNATDDILTDFRKSGIKII
ncbi:MAG: DeoR/GlpR transcriptional regulator [Clostridia bacterium]|nr:DeoR/GlpR transcriptional regulator [Clostridia bacterium]